MANPLKVNHLSHGYCNICNVSKPNQHERLPTDTITGDGEEPDIYAVGFQEIVELSPQQVSPLFYLAVDLHLLMKDCLGDDYRCRKTVKEKRIGSSYAGINPSRLIAKSGNKRLKRH